jgi:hypothetical protein
MSKELFFTISIYSPRYGHDDPYHFKMNEQTLHISSGKEAACDRDRDGNLSWSGHRAGLGNPFVNILENDYIYPPSVLVMAIESAWEAWLDERLDDIQVKEEFTHLFNWVNMGSKNQPQSDFWSGIF